MSQKEQKHEFRVSGFTFKISKEEAEYRLCTIHEREEPTKYYFMFKGREYAVNQAVEAFDSRLMRTDVQTQHAVQVLRKLGFKVRQK